MLIKSRRCVKFLKTIKVIVALAALCEVIEPYCPKAGNGLSPIGLERAMHPLRSTQDLASGFGL